MIFQSTLPVGGATICHVINPLFVIFQSTLPVGGATTGFGDRQCGADDFNPRSPWGERPGRHGTDADHRTISIHAPRGGSDGFWGFLEARRKKFQSTLPVGGATAVSGTFGQLMIISIHAPRGGSDKAYGMDASTAYQISIHAPRGGSDSEPERVVAPIDYFNPRSPWGERLSRNTGSIAGREFQSTLPVGGATSTPQLLKPWFMISIHAPRGGSDYCISWNGGSYQDFNPRSPWGERPKGLSVSSSV